MGPRKEPRHTFSFLSKIPANKPSPGSPTGPLWTEIPVYRSFCISLENLIKFPLNKKALKKKCPSMFPKSGAPMKVDAHFLALHNISFWGSPVKEPSFKVPFMESLAERCPVPRALHSFFKVPCPHSRFQVPLGCKGATMESIYTCI